MERPPDILAAEKVANALQSHLCEIRAFMDFGTDEAPTPERALFQLVFQVNRQNYISLLASLFSDHVIPAAQLARSLLEESIRWEWMTDDPARLLCLFGEVRKATRLITEECEALGIDPDPFVNPSPFWRSLTGSPVMKEQRFPAIDQMLNDIQPASGTSPIEFKIKPALYGMYRVLCQLTHTSVLGMMAVMQPGDENGEIVVGQKLPDVIHALVLQTGAASVVNVAKYTVPSFSDSDEDDLMIAAWIAKAVDFAGELSGLVGPVHGMTTF